MSSDELIGGTEPGKKGGVGLGRLWSGVFASDYSGIDDRLPVVLPGVDNVRQHGPARWAPRVNDVGGAVMPQRGDPCLVGFDDQNEPWVIAWWPYG